jgi:hypothetical protein
VAGSVTTYDYVFRAAAGMYIALWVIRLARAGVRPYVAVPIIAAMTWSLFSRAQGSNYVFIACMLAAHVSMRGGGRGGGLGKKLAARWDSLTDVVRSSFGRDAAASS